MDIKYIGGADPEMVFLANGEETEVRSESMSEKYYKCFVLWSVYV